MWLPLFPALRVPYSNRTLGRRDGVFSSRDNLGTPIEGAAGEHRERGECWCDALNDAVSD